MIFQPTSESIPFKNRSEEQLERFDWSTYIPYNRQSNIYRQEKKLVLERKLFSSFVMVSSIPHLLCIIFMPFLQLHPSCLCLALTHPNSLVQLVDTNLFLTFPFTCQPKDSWQPPPCLSEVHPRPGLLPLLPKPR